MGLLVPVTWDPLGIYLRGREIEPERLFAAAQEDLSD